MVPLKGDDVSKCWCGQDAVGETPKGGRFRFWCKDHVPGHVKAFRERALMHMQLGRARRLEKIKQQGWVGDQL